MLWKVRAALPDRPGALAALATACGSAGVNILGMQIFPGVDDVTDEIVLDLPRGWSGSETQRLLHDAGCRFVSASPCSEAALVDQATRYVHAARTVLAEPARFPEVVAALFDAEASAPVDGGLDMMELAAGKVARDEMRIDELVDGLIDPNATDEDIEALAEDEELEVEEENEDEDDDGRGHRPGGGHRLRCAGGHHPRPAGVAAGDRPGA